MDAQWHDEVASVRVRELVGLDNVAEGGDEVEMGERDGCERGEQESAGRRGNARVKRHDVHLWAEDRQARREVSSSTFIEKTKEVKLAFPVVPLVCSTSATSFS
jgi:hypothetical protein